MQTDVKQNISTGKRGVRPSKSAHTLRWVLAHEPPVVFDEAARVFENEIRERSDGDIDVQLFRAAEYASHQGHRDPEVALSRAELIASVQRGDIEMAHCYTSALGAVHNRLWAIELPFLFRDYNHAELVWQGPLADQLMAGLPEVGLRGVAFAYSGGFRIVATQERALRSLDDYKGLRLRTAGNPVPEALYGQLGGSAVGAPLEQIRNLHRGGQIDGCEITFVRYRASQLEDIFPVINVTGHSLFTTMTVMNDEWFRKLPTKHQETVMIAGKAACRVERETAIRQEAETRAEFEKRGFDVVEMDKAEHANLRSEAVKLHEQFSPSFGKRLVSGIQSAGVRASN